jgi:hypothetical protein
MPRISRPIPLTLDRPRTLVLDFNACVAIEDQTGANVLTPGFWRDLGPKHLRAALWGALLHDKKNPLKIEQVGELLDEHLDRLSEIVAALVEAWGQALPPAKADPEKPANPPQ